MEKEILFSEKQRFNPWLTAIVFMTTSGIFLIPLFGQIVLKTEVGNHPMSNGGLMTCVFLSSLVSGFIAMMRLETFITKDALSVRFYPIHLKFRVYEWQQIAKIYVRKYDPLFEYGGWGIKGFGDNRLLNTQGNEGIQLVFQNGKKLLIGTQQSEKVTEVLRDLNL